MSTLLYEPGRLWQTLMNQPVYWHLKAWGCLAKATRQKQRNSIQTEATKTTSLLHFLPLSASWRHLNYSPVRIDSCVWLMSSLWNLSQWRGSQFRHCRQTAPTWGSVWRRRRGWAPSLWWWWVKTDRWHYLYMYRKGNIFSDPSCMTCSQFKVASS